LTSCLLIKRNNLILKLKDINIGSGYEVKAAHLTKIMEMKSVCTGLESQLNKYYKDQLLRDAEMMKQTLKSYDIGEEFQEWKEMDSVGCKKFTL